MSRDSGHPLWKNAVLMVTLLHQAAGLLQDPMNAACLQKNNISFNPPPAAQPISFEVPSTSAGPIAWLNGRFAALVLPSPSFPTGGASTIEHELRSAELKFEKKQDESFLVTLVKAIVFKTTVLAVLLFVGVAITVIVPIIGLLVLFLRTAAGWCGGGPTGQPVTPQDAYYGSIFTKLFYLFQPLLVALLMTMFSSIGHSRVAAKSLKTTSQFLAKNAPTVLEKPFSDLHWVTVTNFDEFSQAVTDRVDSCATEIGTISKDVLSRAPLYAALLAMTPKLQVLESRVGELGGGLDSLGRALSDIEKDVKDARGQMESGNETCSNHTWCVENDRNTFVGQLNAFDELLGISGMAAEDIRKELHKVKLSQHLKMVQGSEFLMETAKVKADELKKILSITAAELKTTFDELVASVNGSAEMLRDSLADLEENSPKEVADLVAYYDTTVILVAVTMTIVTAAYSIGSQCSCFGKNPGICGTNGGAWILSGGALYFLLSFVLPMLLSTVFVVSGLGIERFFCHPAQHLTAPESKSFAEFIYNNAFRPPVNQSMVSRSKSYETADVQVLRSEEKGSPEGRRLSRPKHSVRKAKLAVLAGQRAAAARLQDPGEGPLGDLSKKNNVVLDMAALKRSWKRSNKHDPFEIEFIYPEQSSVEPSGHVQRKLLTLAEARQPSVLGSSNWKDINESTFINWPMGNMVQSIYEESRKQSPENRHQTEYGVYYSIDPDYDSSYALFNAFDDDDSFGNSTQGRSAHHHEENHLNVAKPVGTASDILKYVTTAKKLWNNSKLEHDVTTDYFYGEYNRPGYALLEEKILDDPPEPSLGNFTQNASSDTMYSIQPKTDNVWLRRYTKGAVVPHKFRPRRNYLQTVTIAAVGIDVELSRRNSHPSHDDIVKTYGPNTPNKLLNKAPVWHEQKYEKPKGGISLIIEGQNSSDGTKTAQQASQHSTASVTRNSVISHQHSSWIYHHQKPDDAADQEDFPNAVRTAITFQSLLKILGRFEKCESMDYSMFDMLGPEVVKRILSAELGEKSPWLSVFEEDGEPPKGTPIDNIQLPGTLLNLPPELKNSIDKLKSLNLTPAFFAETQNMGQKAEETFGHLVSIRSTLEKWSKDTTFDPNSQDTFFAQDALSSLQKISPAKESNLKNAMDTVLDAAGALKTAADINGKPFKTFLDELLPKWPDLEQNLTLAATALSGTLEEFRRQVNSDIGMYFEHAKTQVQKKIGRCKSLYKLYQITVHSVCDDCVRRIGAFWLTVWLWYLFAVPMMAFALGLSTYYAKGPPHQVEEPAGTMPPA